MADCETSAPAKFPRPPAPQTAGMPARGLRDASADTSVPCAVRVDLANRCGSRPKGMPRRVEDTAGESRCLCGEALHFDQAIVKSRRAAHVFQRLRGDVV